MKLRVLLLLVVFALAAAGCQALEIGVNAGRAGSSIDITVSEAELNALLAEAATSDGTGVTFLPTIQFDNGRVILNASLTDETGVSATGSIAFVVTEEDNQLRLYTTTVALNGTDASGAPVLNLQVELNRDIAAQTAGQTGAVFTGEDSALYVQSILITPGELNVRVMLPR
jgi:hypothetical protein